MAESSYIFPRFVAVVPNYCWYGGQQYECGLSLSCVFSGAKALDLCNGGMIWSCCVPKDRVHLQVTYVHYLVGRLNSTSYL